MKSIVLKYEFLVLEKFIQNVKASCSVIAIGCFLI